MICFMIEG